jgi:hypothetical protein
VHYQKKPIKESISNRDYSCDKRAFAGAFHLSVDMPVDNIIEHASRPNNQRCSNKRAQKRHHVVMSTRAKKKTGCSCHGVAIDNPRLGEPVICLHNTLVFSGFGGDYFIPNA